MVRFLISATLFSAFVFALTPTVSGQIGSDERSGMSAEKELRAFYDSYADDLREHKRDAIGERYDRRGV